MDLTGTAPIANSSRSQVRSAADRIADAFAAEEYKGLRLAFRLRLIALALSALFLLFLSPWPQVLYFHSLMLGFIATGLLSLIRGGARPGPTSTWTRWLLPLADMALVTFALIQPNPFGGEEWFTPPMRLRLDNSLWLLLFVALSTLTYSPRQVMWTGISGAICWIAATFWISALPGVVFTFRNGEGWHAMTPEQQTAAVFNPYGVSGIGLAKQIFLLLVVSGLLAAAVQRSRMLVFAKLRSKASARSSPAISPPIWSSNLPMQTGRSPKFAPRPWRCCSPTSSASPGSPR